MKAFDWPDIRIALTVDGVVTVVDGAAVAPAASPTIRTKLAAQRAADPSVDHDNPLEEVYEDQLLCADLVMLNKTDLLSDAERRASRTRSSERVPRAVKIVATREGRVDCRAFCSGFPQRPRTISRRARRITTTKTSTTTTTSKRSSSTSRRSRPAG